MSHFVERKEKDCLDCGATVYGRYCHVCGQENIEPKETFWHLVTHFTYDVTHFDGKFFSSVKYLLLKPGFLSKEYVRGKRMSFLNPIRMYVFISAFFFLFFFSVVLPSFNTSKESNNLSYKKVKENISARIEKLQKEMKDEDTASIQRQTLQHVVGLLQQDLQTISKDTTHLNDLNYYNNVEFVTVDKKYTSLAGYDSVQRALPVDRRDSWLKKVFSRKILQIKDRYQNKNDELTEKIFEIFRHLFPQMLFVSLPLFALLLKLLYIRRKKFFYVDHVIYSVHLYCAMFILMFVLMSLSQLHDFRYLHWLDYISALLWIYIVWYIYKSMKVFYNQGVGKTILKFFLLLFMSTIVMSMLFTLFILLSVFTV